MPTSSQVVSHFLMQIVQGSIIQRFNVHVHNFIHDHMTYNSQLNLAVADRLSKIT